MNDVAFLGGHGNNLIPDAQPKKGRKFWSQIYNNTHTADSNLNRRWGGASIQVCEVNRWRRRNVRKYMDPAPRIHPPPTQYTSFVTCSPLPFPHFSPILPILMSPYDRPLLSSPPLLVYTLPALLITFSWSTPISPATSRNLSSSSSLPPPPLSLRLPSTTLSPIQAPSPPLFSLPRTCFLTFLSYATTPLS